MNSLVRICIFGVAFVPLIEWRFTEFGATAGKIIVFRLLVEGAVLFLALQIVFGKKDILRELRGTLHHPVTLAFIFILVSMAVSALFAVNPTRAFWGTLERGEGVFGVFHYLIFFFLLAFFLTRKERLFFLKCLLFSGYVVLFRAFAEKWEGAARVTSSIGNAAFLAEHFLFLIAVAWIVMQESKTKGIWWHVALSFIPFAVGGIIITGTRGAILGLGAGVVVFLFVFAVRKFGKKIIWGTAIVCMIGVIGIWREGARLQILAGERSGSIQTRLTMWEAGWQAFQEKPFIGWGPEHFILASSAHYNPKAARYGETWFDRAHNKIIDVVVAQGIVGGIIFLGFIGSVLFVVRNDRTYKKPLTLAFGSAYLVQAMFAPDQFVSWIGLMAFLGYMVGREKDEEKPKKENTPYRSNLLAKIGAAGAGVFMALAFYYGNVLPYRQLKILFEARGADDPVLLLKKVVAKDTFVRAEAEANLFDFYMDNRPDLIMKTGIGDLVREEARSLAEKEPQDIRHGIRYARVALGQADKNDMLYGEAEEELKKLAEIAPKRQEIYYLLAQVSGLQGKFEEAIKTAERAVALDPEVARAHYFLGLALALGDDPNLKERAMGEFIRAEALNPSLDTLYASDLNNLFAVYKREKRWDRVTGIVLRKVDGVISWTRLHEEMYIIALFHLAEEKNKEAFVKVAAYMQEEFPEKKEEARSAIEFAEQEKWEIIQDMFEFE
ncbi:MAG: O-antigen ligase family protein [Patescibacteria group bacterium]